jgi:hypothetical protein
MTSATHFAESDVAPDPDAVRYRRRARVLGWIAVSLGIAVVGLVGWINLGSEAVDTTTEQDQMMETIDAYIAAWNTGDGAAADALMDPNGYLEDVGGRWYVAENEHSNYIDFLHMTGFHITRGEPVFVNNVVVVPHEYAAGNPYTSPNIYYMYPDGSKIWWVLEPYPLGD